MLFLLHILGRCVPPLKLVREYCVNLVYLEIQEAESDNEYLRSFIPLEKFVEGMKKIERFECDIDWVVAIEVCCRLRITLTYNRIKRARIE
jgi:hypothetical protein